MTVVRTLPVLVLVLALYGAARAGSIEERDTDGVVSAPDAEPSAVEVDLIAETNALREAQGLAPVAPDTALMDAARYFAGFMARTDRYGHRADGQRPSERAEQHGYDYCIVLENIAYRYRSEGYERSALPALFVGDWKKSPGHRDNMLDPDVSEIGVAVARSEDSATWYAVQMFGRPESERIEFRVQNESDVPVRYVVGDRSFPLAPRRIRSHGRCRPTRVVFEMPRPGAEGRRDVAFEPRDGDRFTLRRGEDGALAVARDG